MLESKTDAFLSMLSAAAQYPDGAHVALVVGSADEDIPRAQLLVLLAREALEHQQALAAASVDAVDVAPRLEVAEAASEVIEAAISAVTDEMDLVPLEVGTAVGAAASDTSRMDTQPPKARPPVLVEEEAVAAEEVGMETIGHRVEVVVMAIVILALVAQTTSPWGGIAVIAEVTVAIEIANAMVGMTATARGNVLMRTTTTIQEHDGGTDP